MAVRGHGAPRKTFGFTWASAQVILGMNIMGAGSVLAILGGLVTETLVPPLAVPLRPLRRLPPGAAQGRHGVQALARGV